MKINKNTLFMRYPSTWWHDLWREGLVCGNGLIGANVYGGVKEETTMLTHHDLWHNGCEDQLPDVSDSFYRLSQKMDQGDFQEASWEIVNSLNSKHYKTTLESPLPLADFKMSIEPICGFSEYIRGIHMDSGEVGCEWKDGSSERSSYLFVSRKENMIIKKVSSNLFDLNVLFSMDAHINNNSDTIERYGRHILDSKETHNTAPFIVYTAKNDDDTWYGAVARICTQNGSCCNTPLGIQVRNSNEIIIFIKLFIKISEENKESTIEYIKRELSQKDQSYSAYLEEHSKLHSALFNSADFSLNYKGKYHCNEDLLAQSYTGKQSPELIEKLWKYGRYLFICGTSQTGNPFPLYGLWGGDYRLIWSHNMANENTQMIYWHTYTGNLLSLQESLYKYYNDRIPAYQNNAQKLFGMRGIYMTAGTTPSVSTPNQVVPVIINWVSAAGWIAQHYYNYYQYTKDQEYLESTLLPFMEQVATFYEDFITFYEDGSIKFYPSVSPENTPQNFMPPEEIVIPHPMPTTINATIDLAIVKEFFSNMLTVAKETDLYQDRVPYWKKIINSIPPYRINEDGAVREWQDTRFDDRYFHRHLSHLYPVFPGCEVNDNHNEELLPAFHKAVTLRKIDAQTGWSAAHMANIYARLGDSENAMICLNNMTRSSLTNNFFTLHNDWRGMNLSLCMEPAPVQLDAIMGYVNAIQEMLFYSSGELIKLLPAVPKELSKGKVNNFRYMHGFVKMQWDIDKKYYRIVITAFRKHEINLKLPDEFTECQFKTHHCNISKSGNMYRLDMENDGRLTIS